MALEHHDKVDLVAVDNSDGKVMLVMVEPRPWGDEGALLPDLQEKLNCYLIYALDGQLGEDYPATKGLPVKFRLACAEPPGPLEQEFLAAAQERFLAPEGIGWELGPLEHN